MMSKGDHMECSFGSPYGRHDTEYCVFLGCYGIKVRRRAEELYKSVEEQLKKVSSLKKEEPKEEALTLIIP